MDFPLFIASFEAIIESKVDNPSEKLYFLNQYTTGRAKELIKGCMQRRSFTSFDEAKDLLKKHFGDPFRIASAYISKLTAWPSIKPNDNEALHIFSIFLEQALNAMESQEYLNDLNTAHVLST